MGGREWQRAGCPRQARRGHEGLRHKEECNLPPGRVTAARRGHEGLRRKEVQVLLPGWAAAASFFMPEPGAAGLPWDHPGCSFWSAGICLPAAFAASAALLLFAVTFVAAHCPVRLVVLIQDGDVDGDVLPRGPSVTASTSISWRTGPWALLLLLRLLSC